MSSAGGFARMAFNKESAGCYRQWCLLSFHIVPVWHQKLPNNCLTESSGRFQSNNIQLQDSQSEIKSCRAKLQCSALPKEITLNLLLHHNITCQPNSHLVSHRTKPSINPPSSVFHKPTIKLKQKKLPKSLLKLTEKGRVIPTLP